jgi:hypothetical protein
MTTRRAVLILLAGIASLAAMIAALVFTGGVEVNDSGVTGHQETHPDAFGVSADVQPTIRSVTKLLTAVANGTTLPTVARSQPSTAPTVAPVGVGESVVIDGTRFIIGQILDPEPAGFFKPPAGKRFVAVEVTQEAVSAKSQYSIAFIYLRGDDGKDYGWTNGNTKPVLGDGTLDVGQSAHGWVTIQMPADVAVAAVVSAQPAKPRTVIATVH